jgi:hypothetical protein
VSVDDPEDPSFGEASARAIWGPNSAFLRIFRFWRIAIARNRQISALI